MTMDAVKREEGVDVNGKPKVTINSPKFSEPFEVYKSHNGFALFNIRSTKGLTAKELQGNFTSLRLAEETLMKYITKAKKAPTVRRKEFGDKYEASKVKNKQNA